MLMLRVHRWSEASEEDSSGTERAFLSNRVQSSSGSWEVPGICAGMWGVGRTWPAASHPSSYLFLLLTHSWGLTKSSASFLSPLCLLSNSIPFTHAAESKVSQAFRCIGTTWGSCLKKKAGSGSAGPGWALCICISNKLPKWHGRGQSTDSTFRRKCAAYDRQFLT